MFTGACLSTGGGGAIPACIAGGIPACLATVFGGGGLQANTQGGSGGGSGLGPQPSGKMRGIWSRPTPKGEVEGDLPGGCLVLGGCLIWGGGAWSQGGACSRPLGRLVLRAVRILLECILVLLMYSVVFTTVYCTFASFGLVEGLLSGCTVCFVLSSIQTVQETKTISTSVTVIVSMYKHW